MEAGDLVMLKDSHQVLHGGQWRRSHVGLVVETGVYAGRKDLLILWSTLNEICTEASKYFEVVDESR